MTLLKDIIGYFRIFRKYLGKRLYIVFFLTALAVATEAFGIALLLPLLEMIETGAAAENDPHRISLVLGRVLEMFGIADSMIGILVFIAIVFIFKGIIRFGEGSYKGVLSANLLREMKGGLFESYSNMTFAYYSERNTGHFINVISEQTVRLLHAFEAYKKFLSEIIITLIYLVFAFLISWKFALMATAAGIAVLYLFNRLNSYVKSLSRKTSKEHSSLHGLLVQTIHAFPYVSATGQFARLGTKVMASIYRLTGYYRNQQIAHAFTQSVREPVSVLVILAIVIAQLTLFEARIAPILVSLLLIYRAMGHFIAIQAGWQQTMSMVGGLEMVEEEFRQVAEHQESDGTRRPGPLSKEIRLENVRFTYAGRQAPALQDIHLRIEARSTVALFGPSGSGKSTLTHLLTMLLTPQQGTMLIDGVPHHELDRSAWRRQIGLVPQDVILFDDTIANNIILWGGGDAQGVSVREKMISAAERADALSFIESLPEGFETKVGDRGVRLSGGQKQRLAIARELFKEPQLLILDEATSALDSESERSIHNSMQRLRGSMTIVIIAHRLSTIQHADRIFVLEEGRLAAEGRYEELKNRLQFQKS